MAQCKSRISTESGSHLQRSDQRSTCRGRTIRTGAGFTVVELLIVIVVIAILAAIVIVAYNGIVQRTRDTALQLELRQAADQVAADQAVTGSTARDLGAVNGGSGIQRSDDVTLTYYPYGNSFCLTASRPGVADTYRFDSQTGTIDKDVCSAFVRVPGDARFGTSDFYVLKYEAKKVAGKAVGQADGLPWTEISLADARTAASAACGSCHLITEAEWMTIAANVLSVPSNWTGGAVGAGHVFLGHSDDYPGVLAASSDDDPYYGTGNWNDDQRRTLRLTTGDVIWDISGNVWEWTDATIAGGSIPGIPGQWWQPPVEWNDSAIDWAAFPTSSRPSAISTTVGGYTSAQGIGQLFSNRDESNERGFMRGGSWDAGAGVLSLYLRDAPSVAWPITGFRIVR